MNLKPISNKKAQVAIFVIIAIVIVASIALFFFIRSRVSPAEVIPAEYQRVFDYYQGCIEREAMTAVDLAGSQGGRVYTDAYIPGSDYAPFGNQLNFLGFPVPYWYYISGNGLIREKMPLKSEMEADIARYIEENVNINCNFDEFYKSAYYIEMGAPNAQVTVSDNSVAVKLSGDVAASKENGSARKTDFALSIPSKLGRFYGIAKEIYDFEKKEAFLENYSVDVLRLYAPVDGVERGCAGKMWKTRTVVADLKKALEANIAAIKFKGDYYTNADKYFIVDKSVSESVNLIYSQAWPTKVEINGADGELMVAKPVGNQQGMGMMGFCYAPYHFVYDISFPVMIQIYDNDELFQFPVAVIIDKNVPRKADFAETPAEEETSDICLYPNQDVAVNIYDVNLARVDANVSFECFNQKCKLGESRGGILEAKAPSCYNGYLVTSAPGYAEKRQLFSSNEESAADVILDREREVEIELRVDGEKPEGMAIVSLASEARTATTVLPDANKIKLSEGLYNITVYVYGASNVTIPEASKTQCREIPKSGLLGFFGGTREECTQISIPATTIDNALAGGGQSFNNYIFDSELETGKMIINVGMLPKPTSIEQLQLNYEAFSGMGVEIGFE